MQRFTNAMMALFGAAADTSSDGLDARLEAGSNIEMKFNGVVKEMFVASTEDATGMTLWTPTEDVIYADLFGMRRDVAQKAPEMVHLKKKLQAPISTKVSVFHSAEVLSRCRRRRRGHYMIVDCFSRDSRSSTPLR